MRLFVAVNPDPATQALIAAEQSRMREALREFEGEIRWPLPSAIHLTLSFLGEIADAAPVEEALHGCRFDRMELELGGLGLFPNTRRPTVLWLGVTDPTSALAQLQAAVTNAMAPFVEPEHRRFRPHLTMARVAPLPRSRIGATFSSLEASAPAIWPIHEFSLMRSELSQTGARYSTIRKFFPG